MLFLYIVFAIALGALFVAGILEQKRHYQSLESIPIRVLINGIRGKSSVTRLVAGALRGGNIRTVAKTTGSAARLISTDGHEVPVYRKFGIANVSEQVQVVKRAAAEQPEALVIECMAVEPALQEVSQRKLIRSTVGVISNVREDHLAEMGPTLEEVARSLSTTMPWDCPCVTAESELGWVLEEEARKRRTHLIYADPESVTDEEMDHFEYFTFKENVAIALAVAQELGVAREDALRGMWEAAPDPGVLTVESYFVGDKHIRFANVFAANDPNSTRMNFDRLLETGAVVPPIITLINCRPDRVERNRQMGELVEHLLTDVLVVIGHPSRSAVDAAAKSFHGRVVDLGGEDVDPEDILRAILEEVDGEASVVAIGNIHGQGERLLEYLDRLGALQ
ncbi:MAG: poly-gamma-glutamate synthase PgsB [Actinomycetota bacterium]